MRGARVLVVGDVMLDEFLWGRVARISPEAPVPVVEVTRQSFHLGGAGNVASNVRALGGQAVLAGVIGRDAAGDARARRARARRASRTRSRLADGGRPTTDQDAHHRPPPAGRARRPRADRRPRRRALEDALRRALARAAAAAAARVIVSDYQKGVVTAAADEGGAGAGPPASACRCSWIPRSRHFALYRGVAVVTPNQAEAEQATRRAHPRRGGPARRPARRSCGACAVGAALITRGEHGMSLFEPAASARAHPHRRPRGLRRDRRRRHRDRDPGARPRRAGPRCRRRPCSRTSRPASWWASSARPRRRPTSCWRRVDAGCRMNVAVVGAGPAGSLLACAPRPRRRRASTVFDASHPREKPCGGGLTAKALALLPPAPADDPLPGAHARRLPLRVRRRAKRSSVRARAARRHRPRGATLDAWLLRRAVAAGARTWPSASSPVDRPGALRTAARPRRALRRHRGRRRRGQPGAAHVPWRRLRPRA